MKKILSRQWLRYIQIFLIGLVSVSFASAVSSEKDTKALEERLIESYTPGIFVYNFVDSSALSKINKDSGMNSLLDDFYKKTERLVIFVVAKDLPKDDGKMVKNLREMEKGRGKKGDQTVFVYTEKELTVYNYYDIFNPNENPKFWGNVRKEFESSLENINVNELDDPLYAPEGYEKIISLYVKAFINNMPAQRSTAGLRGLIEKLTSKTRSAETQPSKEEPSEEKPKEATASLNTVIPAGGCCQHSSTTCMDSTKEQCSSLPKSLKAIFFADSSCSNKYICSVNNPPNDDYKNGYEATVRYLTGQYQDWKLTLLLYDLKDSKKRKQWLEGFKQAFASSDSKYSDKGEEYAEIVGESVKYVEAAKEIGFKHATGAIYEHGTIRSYISRSQRESRSYELGWKAGYIRGYGEAVIKFKVQPTIDKAEEQAEAMYNSLTPFIP